MRVVQQIVCAALMGVTLAAGPTTTPIRGFTRRTIG